VLRNRRPDQPLRVGARPRLDRIAEQAQQYPEMKFFTLAHHLDVAMLERAFWSLNPKIAAGVDRVTWQQYKRELEFNLDQYYGVRCNSQCLNLVFYTVERAWRYWLNRRGGRKLTWQAFGKLLAKFTLPRPKIMQPWV